VFSRAPVEVARRAQAEASGAARNAEAAVRQTRIAYENVLRVARAGGFKNPALEAAQRAQAEATADVRAQETAVRQAQVAQQNAESLVRAGQFANPALEAARAKTAEATEAENSAEAALENAQASVTSAQAELKRRRELASAGGLSIAPTARSAARSGDGSIGAGFSTKRSRHDARQPRPRPLAGG